MVASGGDAHVPYSSLPSFLKAIGVCKGDVCDISEMTGCFLCPFIQKLFLTLSSAVELLWNAIINNTWMLLVLGLVIFMIWQAYLVMSEANKENASINSDGERKLNFGKWFDSVKKQVIRVMIASALLGAAGMGGSRMLSSL